MMRKFIFVLTIVAMIAAYSNGPAMAVGQTTTQEKDSPQPAPPEKKPKKNIFGENSQKSKNQEGWAARDLRKKGYDPQNLTGKDFRKILGAE
ncbi:hypothetical protein [Thiovibrio frasassiensis]|uniref:SHOCT domain-containing protein n=1 Tax=Thiovibrio frasassiensis TaxID=2984131 RepID=A0A9X4MFY2_9BACT|nr:hypothetical protein [Thiovibrio frasassiensis]MDG4475601.1 hypothetical protein [Thiovibrio frasassiensis]